MTVFYKHRDVTLNTSYGFRLPAIHVVVNRSDKYSQFTVINEKAYNFLVVRWVCQQKFTLNLCINM